MTDAAVLPDRLAAIVEDFASAPADLRLEMLLEYADGLPALPERYAEDSAAMEDVPECQTPFLLATEVDDAVVRLHFDAPPQAPTTRGFAGVLHAGLDGETVDTVAAVPVDFWRAMGLEALVSPLRLRGMSAILTRVQRRLVA